MFDMFASAEGSPWTVARLTQHVRQLLETDWRLQDVWVEGEVSNLRHQAGSGHLYFTLKDAEAQVRCVMWRSQVARLPRLPNDGELVLAHGKIGVYEARGEYQLYCDALKPAGLGDLHRQFELLKGRLEAEGLFDPARKRPLPAVPRQIGVVTSATAAAFQDIQNVLRRRWPVATVILSPTPVQGADAPPQIIAALAALNAHTQADVIIVARGGGSLEDLWCFNDEGVARAVAASRIPVVSGVGHEIDFTLTDFAADARAPTPSAAAEMVAPDRAEFLDTVAALAERLDRAVRYLLEGYRRALDGHAGTLRYVSPEAALRNARQRVDELAARATRRVQSEAVLRRERLAGLRAAMLAVSPLATLARGYAVVTRTADGRLLTDAADAPPGTGIDVRLHEGALRARVEALREDGDGGSERDDV